MNPSSKISCRMVVEQDKDNLTQFKVTAFREFGNPMEIMAFAGLKSTGSFVILHSVIVSSQHRRKGIGSQIVQFALDHAKKQWPTRTIYISSVPYSSDPMTQEDLFRFYEKFGFVRTPQHPFEMQHQGKEKK